MSEKIASRAAIVVRSLSGDGLLLLFGLVSVCLYYFADFSMENATYYAFTYAPSQFAANVKVGDTLSIMAEGDLNCDGAVTSLFMRNALVTPEGGLSSTGVGITNELE